MIFFHILHICYILLFTTIEVYQSMTTIASENPGNLHTDCKKVYQNESRGMLYLTLRTCGCLQLCLILNEWQLIGLKINTNLLPIQ